MPGVYSSLGPSVHGILQARILEWVVIQFFRSSSWSRGRTQVSCIAGRFFSCFSVAQSCLTHFDLMDCSMPGFSVFYHLPELAQTRVHWVSDAIQPPHPLSSLSPPVFKISQHQDLFQWVCCWHQVAKELEDSASASVLPMNIQDWFPLGLTGLISLQSKGLSGVFSNTTAQKHQFFSTQLTLWSNSHIHTWLLEKP